MDTLKEVLSLVVAIIGLLTALIPVYARFLDKKKEAARESEREDRQRARSARRRERDDEDVAPRALRGRQIEPDEPPARSTRRRPRPVEPEDDFDDDAYPAVDARTVALAQTRVKPAAVALIVTGFLGLFFNLFIAVFGYIDEFVTPLSTSSKERVAAERAHEMGVIPANPAKPADKPGEVSDQTAAIMAIFMLLSCAVAAVMAIWAGFNMLNLRSYWLSVAGSFAIMPGGCFCCLVGVPVGIWCLAVLLNRDVSQAFE
ncbi:MAG: hypothetical protein U0736_10010 [Gemmataceae bacterium]